MCTITSVRIGKERIFMGKGVRELLDATKEQASIEKTTELTDISYP